MKSPVFTFMLAAATGLLLVACNKKAEPETVSNPPLRVEEAVVSITEGKSLELKVMSGGGGYTVSSDDEALVRAGISGNRISLTAGTVPEEGDAAVVTVYDRYGQDTEIEVNVVSRILPMILSTDRVELTIGLVGKEQTEITIEQGNGGYDVSATEGGDKVQIIKDNIAATGKFSIKALGKGTARLKVTDIYKSSEITVFIDEEVNITTDVPSLTFTRLQYAQQIEITTGNGDYELSMSNPAVARAILSGNTTILVTSVSEGTSTLKITDFAGKTHDVEIIVDYGTNYALAMGTSCFGWVDLGAKLSEGEKTAQKLTFEIRCKFNAYVNNAMVMGLESNLVLKLNNATGALKIAGNGGALTLHTGSVEMPLNKWIHIAMTYDNSLEGNDKYALYFDGEKITLTDAKSPSTIHNGVNLAAPANGLQIGRAGTNASTAPNYAVDEVRLWTVARNSEQIRQNMNGIVETSPVGLLGRWGFDVAEATDYIINSSGSKYEFDLTLSQLTGSGANPPSVEVSDATFIEVE